MAIQIKLKNSVVQDSTPDTNDLPAVGEIALNANINSIGGFMRASDNSIVKIFGPGSLSTPTATTTVSGISELATNSETTTGTATNRVVTPAGLNAVTVAERSTSNSTYLALAGGTLTGVVAATAGSNSAPSIHFGDSDSGIFGGTNTVGLTAGGTTGLSVFETNVRVPTKLGINGAVPQTPLDVIANASGYAMAVRGRSADDLSQIRFTSNDYGTIFAELESDATYLATRIGGSEKLRVDSSGRLLIGASSSVPIATNLGLSLQVLGTGFADSSTLLGRFSADTLAPCINFAKSRNATIGSNTIVQDDDELGKIRFYGSDGVDLANYGAEIIASVDGTPGSDDMPGRLVFATTADGASSPTERLRIDSSGNVGIGTTSPAQILHLNKSSGDTYLRLQGGTNQGTLIHATDGTLLGGFVSGGAVGGGASDIAMRVESGNNMLFAHGTTERMRIDSSGNVGIGTSSPLSKLNIVDGSDNDAILFVQGADTTSEYVSLGVQTGKAIVRGGGSGSTNTALAFEYSNAGTETEGMRIDSSGRLLVGGTDASVVHTNADDVVIGNTSASVAGLSIATSTSGYATLQFSDGAGDKNQGQIAYNHADNSLALTTDSSVRMSIDSSGNVGIGISTPNVKLHQHIGTSGTNSHQFTNTTTGTGSTDGFLLGLSGDEHVLLWNYENTPFRLATNGTERMRITSTGRVGLGTTSPDSRLHLSYDSGDSQIRLTRSNAAANTNDYGRLLWESQDDVLTGKIAVARESAENDGYMHFSTASGGTLAERMRIDSAGRLSLGNATNNASPGALLQVKADDGEAADLYVGQFTNLEATAGQSYGVAIQAGSNSTDHGLRVKNRANDATHFLVRGDGNVGIGTASPSEKLDVEGSIECLNELRSKTGNDLKLNAGSANRDIFLQVNDSTLMTVQGSSGNVGIGTTSPSVPSGTALEIYDSSTSRLKLSNSTTGTGSADGFQIYASGSVAVLENKEDAEMRFYTNASEKMRLDTNGNVGIGTSTITDDSEHCKLVISGSTGTAAGILIFQDTSNNEDGMIFADDGSLVIAADRANATAGSTLQFRVDGSSEKMRIDSSGNVYFGVTSTPNGSSVGGSAFIAEDNNREVLYLATTGGTETLVRFHNSNGQVGVISVSGSSTSYVTSSDYRLKENATAISDGITRLKTLKPYRFNWKADASTTVDGFFAHEVTAVPEAITGTKDEVDSDNNPVYQGIDQSKLVPLLVAAVQELIGKVEALEAA